MKEAVQSDYEKHLHPSPRALSSFTPSPSTTAKWTVYLNTKFDDGPQDVASFFWKEIQQFKVQICFLPNALLTLARILDAGAVPNILNKDFLPQAWKEFFKSIKLPHLQTANGDVVDLWSMVLLFIRIGPVRVRVWYVVLCVR